MAEGLLLPLPVEDVGACVNLASNMCTINTPFTRTHTHRYTPYIDGKDVRSILEYQIPTLCRTATVPNKSLYPSLGLFGLVGKAYHLFLRLPFALVAQRRDEMSWCWCLLIHNLAQSLFCIKSYKSPTDLRNSGVLHPGNAVGQGTM